MNCLWLLILLFCSRNSCGQNSQNSTGCNNNFNNCDCERRSECNHDRKHDYDCDVNKRHDSSCDCDFDNEREFERRNFIPFGNQTCGCENNQCQS